MPVKIIAVVAAAALGLCVALLVFTMKRANESSQPSIVLESPQVASAAAEASKPLFVPTAGRPVPPQDVFVDGSGADVRIGDFKGKPVLLNFWATWCAPCVKELPSLARLMASHGGDLVVVAVNLDKTNGADTAAYLKDIQADGLQAFTDPTKKIMRSYRINGLPTTVLIGADGHEIGRHEGDVAWDSTNAKAAIVKAINAPTP